MINCNLFQSPGRLRAWLPLLLGLLMQQAAGESAQTGTDTGSAILPLSAPIESARTDFDFRGINIASEALGGRIHASSSQTNDTTWAATRLIDGFSLLLDDNQYKVCRYSCGWRSERRSGLPQAITFSFYENRQAALQALILHPATDVNRDGETEEIPALVEVWVADTDEDATYRRVATRRIAPTIAPQAIELPSNTRARFVELRLLETHGAERVSLGEVEILTYPQDPILAGLDRDLARVENGGVMVHFSSQSSRYRAAQTVWPHSGRSHQQWRAADGPYGKGHYLPQDLVYAFNDDQVAWVDRVEIELDESWVQSLSNQDRYSLARTLAVQTTLESPLEGFSEVGRFDLSQQGGTYSLRINGPVRFLKLRVISVHQPGRYATLGRVRIIEGNNPEVPSVLLHHSSRLPWDQTPPSAEQSRPSDAGAFEVEPNDNHAQANLLEFDIWTEGIIDPLGEKDVYRLPIQSQEPTVLTLHARGFPLLRNSLAFFQDPPGETPYYSTEGDADRPDTALSLRLDAGDHYLHVTRPGGHFVLIWDTSGSMEGKTELLETAILGFIDRIQPHEHLAMIRFAEAVEQLLPEFSDNRDALRSAAEDRFVAKGGTALYRAINTGLEQLAPLSGNRGIILMTDGQNSGGGVAHEDLWHALDANHIPIYTIALGTSLQNYNSKIGSDGWRFLRHLARATHGQAFYAATADDLPAVYQTIDKALRSPARYQLKPTLSQATGLLEVHSPGWQWHAANAAAFELILDVSGSMTAKLGDSGDDRRIDAAKIVLRELVEALPSNAEVGLRVFGHRVAEYEPGDCQDTELLQRIRRLRRDDMLDQIAALDASAGTTPLAFSLVQAARDFLYHSGQRLLVLVTDGEEYCGADPVQVVESLRAMGFPLQIEVVGLALADGKVAQNMRTLAAAGNGSYHDATDTNTLREALRSALGRSYQLRDAQGQIVATGGVNQGVLEVPDGYYSLTITDPDRLIVEQVHIKAHHLTRVNLAPEGSHNPSSVGTPAPAQARDWDRKRDVPADAQGQAPGKLSHEQRSRIKAALDELEQEVEEAVIHRPKP